VVLACLNRGLVIASTQGLECRSILAQKIGVTEPSKFLQPAPMEGKGAYNRSSSVQAVGSLPAVALLERVARAVPLPPSPELVVIADYGSSEGHNSLKPIAATIRALRERVGHERAIFVFHTDLPGNDFTALFQTLANDPDSYLRNDPAAFAAAVGRSYFEQILPADSVTLGWSAWAVQWLSQVPCVIPDQVQVAYSRDAAARSAFAKQAAEDWRRFLTMRSRELRPGARLVVLTMATDDSGDFGYRPVVDALYGTLVDIVDRGLIRKEEFRRMVIPTFGRTRAQFMEAFAKGGCFEDLSIEDFELFHSEDRIGTQFEASGDAHAFGAQWAAFCRASVFPTLAASLDGAPDSARSVKFFNELETGLTARLAAAPVRMTIPLALMMLVKAGSSARRLAR
jgi:SAM dependent carboxyl methyltransferase